MQQESGDEPNVWIEKIHAPDEFPQDIHSPTPGADAEKSFRGRYVVKEIGRGACGVVYRAKEVYDAAVLVASTGVPIAAYQLLKAWIDARNGRKLKIKVGDIEVEATQLAEKEVLRIFELLQEKADRAKIRELLLETANKRTPPDIR
jgi:hypothetical protein